MASLQRGVGLNAFCGQSESGRHEDAFIIIAKAFGQEYITPPCLEAYIFVIIGRSYRSNSPWLNEIDSVLRAFVRFRHVVEPMDIRGRFGFGEGEGDGELPGSPILTLANAEKFLNEARTCFNDANAAEFLKGMRIASRPLRLRVRNEMRETFGFRELRYAIQGFAMLTRGNPEPMLHSFMQLPSQLDRVAGIGARFVIAQLILAYASQQVSARGSTMDLMRLEADALSLFKAALRYYKL